MSTSIAVLLEGKTRKETWNWEWDNNAVDLSCWLPDSFSKVSHCVFVLFFLLMLLVFNRRCQSEPNVKAITALYLGQFGNDRWDKKANLQNHAWTTVGHVIFLCIGFLI